MSKVSIQPFSFSSENMEDITPLAEPTPVDEVVEETPEEQNIQQSSSFSFEDPEQIAEPAPEPDLTPEKITTDVVDYKALGDFLVETGVWKDFEGREDFEFSNESFQALWEAQAKNQVGELLNEERSQFGSVANQLIDYLKHGGTVDNFVSNYTQEVDFKSIDTTEELGQEKVIKEYYKSLDWSDAKIKKHIERLKDAGDVDFKEEADDCKTKLVEAIESERDEMLKEQVKIDQDRKIQIYNFNKSIKKSIYEDENLADREKKDLEKFLFENKYQDKQGNKYPEFHVKWEEIKTDPTKYAKLVKFIKNFDSFEDKAVVEKQQARKTFEFLKKGTSLEGAVSKEPTKQKQQNLQPFKFR